jgi:endonuclease/exonuclease/phosphatase family metal-dependent hydrolase
MTLFKKIVLTLGILGSITYFFTCLTPYVNPSQGYFFTFAGLFFPIGLCIMFCWCLVCLLLFRKYAWFFFLLLFVGYKNIFAVLGFHPGNQFVQTKSKSDIRILSWNVDNFLSGDDAVDSTKLQQMLDFIKNSQADILCFQDYSSFPNQKADASTENIKKITGLPYSYFSEADANYGVIIFSRWPFLKQTTIPYRNINSIEALQWVDIQPASKVLRIFNTHLSSMNVHVDVMDKDNINHLKFINYDTAILMRRDKLGRMAYFDKLHAKQAELVKQSMDSCHTPFIFTADMNAVPSSFVYHEIRAGLNDAFLEKGWGFGRTYDSLSPTLRIDVLLTSKSIKTTQYVSPRLHLSDHLPIITDIQFKP